MPIAMKQVAAITDSSPETCATKGDTAEAHVYQLNPQTATVAWLGYTTVETDSFSGSSPQYVDGSNFSDSGTWSYTLYTYPTDG